jgi:hypothetical protein
MVGDLEVPAATMNCAGCHGRRGEGKTEGGVTAGNLTWSNLTKSYGHTHPSGRKHGAFNESSFTTAVVRGVDPAGNDLAIAMPRYRLSIEEMNGLIAYIKQLEFNRDPGLTSESIDVGVPLPTSTALAGLGQAVRQVMSAYFDDLNARGGIYNRKIRPHFTENATDISTSLRNLNSQNHVFAFIGGVSAGADKEIASFAREEEIPFIGPATLLPQAEHPPNRYLFYLLPGVSEGSGAGELCGPAARREETACSGLVSEHGVTFSGGGSSVGSCEGSRLAGRRQDVLPRCNVRRKQTRTAVESRGRGGCIHLRLRQ